MGMRMIAKRNRIRERTRRNDVGLQKTVVDAETVTFADVFWSLSPRLRSTIVVMFFLLIFFWTFWESPILLAPDAPQPSDGDLHLHRNRFSHPETPESAGGGVGTAPGVGGTSIPVGSEGPKGTGKENEGGRPLVDANSQPPSAADGGKQPTLVQGSDNMQTGGQSSQPASSYTSRAGTMESSVVHSANSQDSWRLKRPPGETQSCFVLGGKQDHLCTFSPLCIEPETFSLVAISGMKGCSANNRSVEWLHSKCNHIRDESLKESVFPTVRERSVEWLAEKEKEAGVVWIEGGSILQMLERNCGNIAHYTGRIFFMHHVLSNSETYFDTAKSLRNVLIWPGVDVMKRFAQPEKYAFWHSKVLEAIVHPSKLTFSSLEKFAQHAQAVVPGYMKGRYFAADNEYPSSEPSNPPPADAPFVPRDSIKFRAKVNHLLRGTPTLGKVSRKLVFLDRAQAAAARRAIEPASKERLFSLINLLASQNGYKFVPVVFEELSFTEQEEVMRDVAISIGVHGANLVNCVFQPAYTVLLELMPYQFEHDMYVEAGHAGIKYYTHQMNTGLEYDGREKYTSTADCINKDHDCKVHYRDQRLTFKEQDLTEVNRILSDGFSYLARMEEAGHIHFSS